MSIDVQGHTDTLGPKDYNQRLSERRKQAVIDELVRLGVPVSSINGSAYGETRLAVPTDDNVYEQQNRRVDIQVVQPPPPPPPAPAPAPQPPVVEAPPPPPPPAPKLGLLSAGLFYGHNFENDSGGQSELIGLNLGLDYNVLPWVSVGLEQAGFYHFETRDDGPGGRSAFSLDLAPFTETAGGVELVPHIGGNIGYLYGDGIDDDFFAGPEIGVRAGIFNAKVAYDIPWNRDLDQGIVNVTLGVGFPF